MYGTHTTAGAGAATLAYTGAQTGSLALAAVGLLLAGIALLALLRRPGKARP